MFVNKQYIDHGKYVLTDNIENMLQECMLINNISRTYMAKCAMCIFHALG